MEHRDLFLDEWLEEETKPWEIESDSDAEWLIDTVNDELAESSRLKIAITNKISMLQDRLKKVEAEEQIKIEKRDSHLLRYFEKMDEKMLQSTKTQSKYRLPSADLIKKKPLENFIRDEDKLVSFLEKNKMNDFVKVEKSPKWGELKKEVTVIGNQVALKETGEIVEGVSVSKTPPKFIVEVK